MDMSRRSRSPRSLSHNFSLINGQIIDNDYGDGAYKQFLLDQITEENADQSAFNRVNGDGSDETEESFLEDAVKQADENVQKFITDISVSGSCVEEENMDEFQAICKSSEEELKNLSNFLTKLNEHSKNKILDTLISVYKSEILDQLKTTSKCEHDEKVCNFKRICKELISLQDDDEFSALLEANGRKKFDTDYMVNYHSADISLENLIDTKLGTVFGPISKNGKSVSTNTKPQIHSLANEEDVAKLLKRKITVPIARTEYIIINYPNITKNDPPPTSSSSRRESKISYEKIKKKFENVLLTDLNPLISEGIQAKGIISNENISSNNLKKSSVDYVKPFKYKKNFYESKSDLGINCNFGCPVKLKKSKSDTDNIQTNENVQISRRKRKNSLIEIERKSSQRILGGNNLNRQNNKLINYVDSDLKRGDSSIQFSQVLFESANKNFENNVSSDLEIPTVDQTQVEMFNPNYLLHSLKIASQSKAAIVTKNYSTNFSDISEADDEDYIMWLAKKKWSKYSKTKQDLKLRSRIDELKSISEIHRRNNIPQYYKEIQYSDDKASDSESSIESNLEKSPSLMDIFTDNFLYEHIVINNAMNFFLTINAKRTRRLNILDRLFQASIFIMLYVLWNFFSNFIFIDGKFKRK